MFPLRSRHYFSACVAAMALWSAGPSFADKAGSTVLLIPARSMVIQIAFDLASIRNVSVVTYQRSDASGLTYLHRWNDGSWVPTDAATFQALGYAGVSPRRLVVIRSEQDTPPSEVIDGADWATQTTRLDTLDSSSIVNTLGTVLGFRAGEWEWMADRHGLTLIDRNAQRRRFGRYGPPSGDRPLVRAPDAASASDVGFVEAAPAAHQAPPAVAVDIPATAAAPVAPNPGAEPLVETSNAEAMGDAFTGAPAPGSRVIPEKGGTPPAVSDEMMDLDESVGTATEPESPPAVESEPMTIAPEDK
jgi:hypothetical protein